MNDGRERALEIALVAMLISAREQGIHVNALCDGAAGLIAELPDIEQYREMAYRTVKSLSRHVAVPE
jgi:hypothetical protein